MPLAGQIRPPTLAPNDTWTGFCLTRTAAFTSRAALPRKLAVYTVPFSGQLTHSKNTFFLPKLSVSGVSRPNSREKRPTFTASSRTNQRNGSPTRAQPLLGPRMPRQRLATRPETIPPRHAAPRRLPRRGRPQRRLPTEWRLEARARERRRCGTGADPAGRFMVRRPLERCCTRTRKKAAASRSDSSTRWAATEPARSPMCELPGQVEHGRERGSDIGALRAARQPRHGTWTGQRMTRRRIEWEGRPRGRF